MRRAVGARHARPICWAGSPGAPANYGELIPPRALPARRSSELRGKWVLVTFDAAACDAYCERKLYFMRQVRRAQGKDMERIERLWVLTDARQAARRAAGRDRRHAASPASRPPTAFRATPADHIYLVDPLGNLMMRFPRDPDPSKMIKDLQRLLKYSRFG